MKEHIMNIINDITLTDGEVLDNIIDYLKSVHCDCKCITKIDNESILSTSN